MLASSIESLLRLVVPVVPALAMALLVDATTVRRGLTPPGFLLPLRRSAMTSLLALIFYLGVFAPLAFLGSGEPIDPADLATPELFAFHALLVLALLVWFVLGYGSRETDRGGPLSEALRQCGLETRTPLAELRLGLGGGLLLWLGVVLVLLATTFALERLGQAAALPDEVPPLVLYMAGLPVAVRIALSVSAGVVEEVFFRGFLQPRIGVALSSLLFVLAHASYEQPFMLVGVALLSLGFARLAQLRGNVWAAIVAHTLFDALQLLWLIPLQVSELERLQPPGL